MNTQPAPTQDTPNQTQVNQLDQQQIAQENLQNNQNIDPSGQIDYDELFRQDDIFFQDILNKSLEQIQVKIEELEERNPAADPNHYAKLSFAVQNKYNMIDQMRSSQDPNLCILSHEIMAMRYKLYECIKEGNIDKNGLSNFDLLNILIEENERELYNLRQGIHPEVPSIREDRTSNADQSEDNLDLNSPNSIYDLAFNLMDKFMEQFQFQLKFSADLTKFLKHESPAFQRLKETYEEVNEKREKLKTKGEDHEQGADIEKSNYDFREFLYHSMNEMEKSHKDLVMPILAEDVIKLKTLISDVQSLMIEDIRKHLNAKNKPKK